MKKLIVWVLLAMFAVNCACAELQQEQMDLYVGDEIVDVQIYSEGQKLYVDLEQLIAALGGTYQQEQGKIVICLNGGVEAVPSAASETPSVSWEYINYWLSNNIGYANAEEWMTDFFFGADEQRQKVTDMINTAIEKIDDVEKFMKALEDIVYSGGYATNRMEELIK